MTDILRSLWGRTLGLSANDELVLNGAVIAGRPSTEVGTKAASSTVTVEDNSAAGVHQTKITLKDTPLAVVSVGAGAGVGGLLLFTFPQGYIHVLGSYASIALSIAAAKQADFTDATPEGQIGVGSLLPANNDALGTDATDDNICTAVDFTMAAYATPAVPLKADAATLVLDGHTTAEDVNLTILVDAGDIDNDVTTQVLATGTILVRWVFAGDVA